MHRSRSILGTLAREPATSLLDHTTFPVQAVESIPYPIKWEPPPVFSGSAENTRRGSSQCSGLAVTSPVRARTAVPGNPCLVNTLRSSTRRLQFPSTEHCSAEPRAALKLAYPGPATPSAFTEARDSDSDAWATFRVARALGSPARTSGTVSTWSQRAARDFPPVTALRAISPCPFGTETDGPSPARRRLRVVYPREPLDCGLGPRAV